MSSFQVRSDGTIAEIGDDGSVIGVVEPMGAMSAPVQQSAPIEPPKSAKPKVLTPRDVVKAAKARAKELKAEIKRLEAAKRELAQMQRLIQAAGGRVLAPVRELKRSAN